MAHIENFGEYSVKNIKSFMGREGLGFNANLYKGKKKIAFAYDDASGGEVDIDWIDRNEEAELDRFCNTLPVLEFENPKVTLTVDAGLFVSELVERFRDVNKMRKQCRTKTLFRSSDEGYGRYRILNAICDDRTRTHLRTKYGNDVEIFNDVLASGGTPSVLNV